MDINNVLEIRDVQSLAYILKDNDLYFETAYKVLQSQEKNGFVRCYRVKQNGNYKFIYDINKYKSLSSIITSIQPNTFITILMNLLDVVVSVINNGFMYCENIAFSMDNVMVDCNNFKVYVIYLPINAEVNADSYKKFDYIFRSGILTMCNRYPNVGSNALFTLCDRLSNPMLNIEEVTLWAKQNNIGLQIDKANKQILNPGQTAQSAVTTAPAIQQTKKGPVQGQPLQQPGQMNQPINIPMQQGPGQPIMNVGQQNMMHSLSKKEERMRQKQEKKLEKERIKQEKRDKKMTSNGNVRNNNMQFIQNPQAEGTELLDEFFVPSIALVGLKTPKKVEYVIMKPEYLIGKKSEMVDGLIDFNNAISRTHCKIQCVDGAYFIVDLDSANGTYVNGKRIPPNVQVPITVGDRIKLANSDFMIRAL